MPEEDVRGVISWFSEAVRSETPSVGIQGTQLSVLYQKKFSVPPGFTITTKACRAFLTENTLVEEIETLLKNAPLFSDAELTQACRHVNARIAESSFSPTFVETVQESYEILNTDALQIGAAKASALTILKNSYEPPFVAVRCSPLQEEEFALPAFMNVKGIEAVMAAIRECYKALFSPAHIRTFSASNQRELPLVAVIVQKMIDADISGQIMPKGEGFLVEAVWGLGSLLSTGDVEPDRYEVQKEHEMMTLKESRVGTKTHAMTRDASGKNIIVELTQNRREQQLLTAADAQRLAKIAEMIFQVFEEPQRITFALTRGELFITGCMPFQATAAPIGSVEHEELSTASQKPIVETSAAPDEAPLYTPASLPVPVATEFGIGRLSLVQGGTPMLYHPVASGVSTDETFQSLATLAQCVPLTIILPGHLSTLRARTVYGSLEAVRRLAAIAPQHYLTVLVPHATHLHHFTDIQCLARTLALGENVQFGIRIETPAGIQLIGKFCDAGVAHIDIDLAQMAQHLLGRRTAVQEQELFAPAILSALKYAHRRAERARISVSVSLFENLALSPRHLETLTMHGAYNYTISLSQAAYVAHLLGTDLHWPEPYKPEQLKENPVEDIEQAVLRELEENESEYQPGSKDTNSDVPPLNDAMSM